MSLLAPFPPSERLRLPLEVAKVAGTSSEGHVRAP